MDGRDSVLNDDNLSVCAGAGLKVGDVIEIGLIPCDVVLPLRLKGVIRVCTNDGFRVEFLADTPDERRELALFRQFKGDTGLREPDDPRFVDIVTKS